MNIQSLWKLYVSQHRAMKCIVYNNLHFLLPVHYTCIVCAGLVSGASPLAVLDRFGSLSAVSWWEPESFGAILWSSQIRCASNYLNNTPVLRWLMTLNQAICRELYNRVCVGVCVTPEVNDVFWACLCCNEYWPYWFSSWQYPLRGGTQSSFNYESITSLGRLEKKIVCIV